MATSTESYRVQCLYRVSGTRQVDYDEKNQADIPLQRKECRKFAEKMGWTIVSEEQENGVSGFKVSAADRDKIQIIKERAIHGEFDILLVFMFDRVGRIASETPFIVEWFVENGIQVWSTQEGEQRFDNHVDRLTNYIRYWQSEGESRKTSIRTSKRLGQIVEDGHFKGGLAPYGYILRKSGRINKKGKELLELVIDDYEADIVRIIFERFTTAGYGPQRISTYLRDRDIKARNGKNWHPSTIRGILRNLTYTGVLRCAESRSQQLPEIQIVDTTTFNLAQEIIAKRSEKDGERSAPLRTVGRSLLSGNVFCGYCGSRISVTTGGKRVHDAAGESINITRFRYTCYGKNRKQVDCDGQTVYSLRVVDGIIDEIVHNIFRQMKGIPKSEVVKRSGKTQERAAVSELNKTRRELEKAANELIALKAEIAKTITGQSKFTQEMLSEVITTTQKRHNDLHIKYMEVSRKVEKAEYLQTEVQNQYDEILHWSTLFDDADNATRRMIVARLIRRVDIFRGCRLKVDFSIDVDSLGLSPLPSEESIENLKAG